MAAKDVMADALKETAKDIGKDFVGSFGADIASMLMFGRPKSQMELTDLKKVKDLFSAGKTEEAMKVLQANRWGIGLADEIMFHTDLLALLRGNLLDPDQAVNKTKCGDFYRFIGSMDWGQRDKFRRAHTLETHGDIRRANLVALSKLDNSLALSSIEISGIFNPDYTDTLQSLNNWASAALPAIRARTAYYQNQIQARHARRNTWRDRGLGRLFNLNILR